jgi:hypothetical protein
LFEKKLKKHVPGLGWVTQGTAILAYYLGSVRQLTGPQKLARWCIIFVLGGAVFNIKDRHIVDFIYVTKINKQPPETNQPNN